MMLLGLQIVFGSRLSLSTSLYVEVEAKEGVETLCWRLRVRGISGPLSAADTPKEDSVDDVRAFFDKDAAIS